MIPVCVEVTRWMDSGSTYDTCLCRGNKVNGFRAYVTCLCRGNKVDEFRAYMLPVCVEVTR